MHPLCARLLSNLLLLYNIGRVHGAISGCTVLGEVHPVSAENKFRTLQGYLVFRGDLANLTFKYPIISVACPIAFFSVPHFCFTL